MRIKSILAILAGLSAISATSPVYAQAAATRSGVPYYYASPSATAPWLEGWVGGGVQNNFYGGWVGAVVALNPQRNVWADGFVIRGEGLLGHYDYPTTALPTGRSKVDLETASLQIGYRKVLDLNGSSMTVTGYIGASYRNDSNSDPTAAIRGSEFGVRVLGEMYWRISQYQDFYGTAWYTTAFNDWFVLARPGFLLGRWLNTEFWLGPEGQVFGNGHGWVGMETNCPNFAISQAVFGGPASCKYDEGRIGGFIHIINPSLPFFGDWIIAGGYRKPLLTNGGPDGYYAQIGLNFHY